MIMTDQREYRLLGTPTHEQSTQVKKEKPATTSSNPPYLSLSLPSLPSPSPHPPVNVPKRWKSTAFLFASSLVTDRMTNALRASLQQNSIKNGTVWGPVWLE